VAIDQSFPEIWPFNGLKDGSRWPLAAVSHLGFSKIRNFNGR